MSEFNHLKNGELNRLLAETIYTYGTRHQFTQRIIDEQRKRESEELKDQVDIEKIKVKITHRSLLNTPE